MTNLDLMCMEEITKVLIDNGMPANLQGFKYFQRAIALVVFEPSKIKKVTRILYPEVGREFNVTGAVVERSMRHAMEKAYFKTGFKTLNKVFGLESSKEGYKPTNVELIAIVAEALRLRVKKEENIA